MVKTAPAQIATRQMTNGTTERRLNVCNGASVRALSTTSRATLASMAATDAIEGKALWIIQDTIYPLQPRSLAPSSCPYSPECVENEFSEVRKAPVQHL